MRSCEHLNFNVTANVQRIHDTKESIRDYMLEVRVYCVDCNNYFAFKGLRGGASTVEPRVGAAGLEVRLPIVPTEFKSDEGLQ